MANVIDGRVFFIEVKGVVTVVELKKAMRTCTLFFISNPIFELSLYFWNSKLKVAKLFDNFRLKCMENKQKSAKLTKVAKNF